MIESNFDREEEPVQDMMESSSGQPEHGDFDQHEDHVFLPFSRKVSYGMGGLTYMLLANGVGQIAIFYNVVYKVDALLVGAVLFLPRLWDAITDPLMGHISDNTRTRWGRRRPYIFWGGLASAVLLAIMLAPPVSFDEDGKLNFLIVTSILFFTTFTVFTVTYQALGMELSLDYHERSRVMGYRAFFYSFGTLLAFWGLWFAYRPFFSSPIAGTRITGILFGVIATAAAIYVALRTRESADAQVQEKVPFLNALKFTYTNKPFLILALTLLFFEIGLVVWIPLQSYVNLYYVFGGDIAAGSALGGMSATLFAILKLGYVPLVTRIGTRIGKEKTLAMGMLVSALGMILTWWLFTPNYPYLQLALQLVLAFSLPTFEIYPQAIMADICDLDELEYGLRREGMFGASLGFAQKIGVAVTPFIVGVVLSFAGFDQNITKQPEEVLFLLRIFTCAIPFLFILVAGILFYAVRVPESRVREVRALLEERRQEHEKTH